MITNEALLFTDLPDIPLAGDIVPTVKSKKKKTKNVEEKKQKTIADVSIINYLNQEYENIHNIGFIYSMVIEVTSQKFPRGL